MDKPLKRELYLLHWEFDETQEYRGWRKLVNYAFGKLKLKIPYPPRPVHEIRRIALNLTGAQIRRMKEPAEWLGDLITQIISYGRVRKITSMRLYGASKPGTAAPKPPVTPKSSNNATQEPETPANATKDTSSEKSG